MFELMENPLLKLKFFTTVAVFALLTAGYAYSEDTNDSGFAVESRTLDCTYEVTIEEIPNTAEALSIWVPLPTANSHQNVLSIGFDTPVPFILVSDEVYQNRFIHVQLSEEQIDNHSGPFKLSVDFRVRRDVVSPSRTTFKFPHIAQADLQKYLNDSNLIKSGGAIAEEAIKVVGTATKPWDQAGKIYSHIVDTMKYDKTGNGWGRGDSVYACTIREGNCSDFHSLFIGELRSLEIPARFIMGFPLPADQKEGVIPGYHCWAEFFLNEQGWHPVDASKAHQFPEMKDSLFGGLDANRIEFTVGRDIVLPNMQDGPLNFSIYPHVEVNGKKFDDVTHTFRFKESE